MTTTDKAMLGVVLVAVGLFLLQKPNCQHGCKTVAEHLLDHGLDDVIGALLA